MTDAMQAVIASAQRASTRARATRRTPDDDEIRAICAHPRPIVGAFALAKSALIAAAKKAAPNDAIFVSTLFGRVTIACPETESVFGANHEATIAVAATFVAYADAHAWLVLDLYMRAIAAADGLHHKNMLELVSTVAGLARNCSIVHSEFTCADLALFGVEIDLITQDAPTSPEHFATCEARVSVTNPHVLAAKLRASGIGAAKIAELLASYAITTEATTRQADSCGNARTLVDVRWLAMGTADSGAEIFASPDKARVVSNAPMHRLKRAASFPDPRPAKYSCRANLGF